jgi:hypothetical protein
VLGINLFDDPSGQRHHDDESAGKFENGVGIGAGQLLFFGCRCASVVLLRWENLHGLAFDWRLDSNVERFRSLMELSVSDAERQPRQK